MRAPIMYLFNTIDAALNYIHEFFSFSLSKLRKFAFFLKQTGGWYIKAMQRDYIQKLKLSAKLPVISLYHREHRHGSQITKKNQHASDLCIRICANPTQKIRLIHTLNTPRKYSFYTTDRPDAFSSVKCDQNVIRRKYT